MGRMHIHQHQTRGILGQNVDAFELRESIAEWRNIALLGGQGRRCSRRAERRKVLAIGTLGLGNR